MLPTEPKVGWVFRYSYLWHWQHLEGREEGDKDRPALVLAIDATLEDGAPVVRVLPITHTPPSDPADAVKIPPATKRRLGLDDERSWIVLTESNASPGQGRTSDRSTRIAAITVRCLRTCSKRSSVALSGWRAARDIGRQRAATKASFSSNFYKLRVPRAFPIH